MEFIDIANQQKNAYNKIVTHPLQSFEWGEFRKASGISIVRRGCKEDGKITEGYTMTIHPIPKLSYTVGYLPKGTIPSPEAIEDIIEQAKKYNCVYVQLEPNISSQEKIDFETAFGKNQKKITPSFHPLFTKYSFVLDIVPPEETLLANMHPKTRYNIRVAQKHNVKVLEDNSEKGFKEFIKLYEETTTRQRFYAHTARYHKTLWELFANSNGKKAKSKNELSYHLLHARLGEETVTSWVLFTFHDTLYYPYGASSRLHRETMASNLIMWEAILLGKKLKLKEFDMWGALGPNPNTKDPWYGFHKFKQGYGATLMEFAGSYDLVLNPALYEILKVGDKLRWGLLGLRKRIR